MANSKSSELHVAMFPYFAFGHLSPFLHLSNKLAQRGHNVSFLLPKAALPMLAKLNPHPNLIQFLTIQVPSMDGLPPNTETTSGLPDPLHNYFSSAYDQTQTQVETILNTLKPHLVLFDHAFWVPSLGRKLGLKSIYFATVSAAAFGRLSPEIKIVNDMTDEELMHTPPGYPFPTLLSKSEISHSIKVMAEEFGSGLSLYERMIISTQECDAIAIRTCREIEGFFCDYISRLYSKKILLTGHLLPQTSTTSKLEDKWNNWLSKFQVKSVVYCAFGSEFILPKDQFRELLLGFELSGFPFLVALRPPNECTTIEEALPEGFEERVQGRGCVYGGWISQQQILKHPSVGCFVSHCGFSSVWESLLSDCQILMIPQLVDQFANAMLMGKVLKAAIEVQKEENGWVSKESLCNAIQIVMNEDSEMSTIMKANHSKWKNMLSAKYIQEKYIDDFIDEMKGLLE